MKCSICNGGELIEAKNSYFAQLPNGYVIIENVPCFSCSQCGEVVYSIEIMEKIDELLEQIQNIASKIFIMDFAKAA